MDAEKARGFGWEDRLHLLSPPGFAGRVAPDGERPVSPRAPPILPAPPAASPWRQAAGGLPPRHRVLRPPPRGQTTGYPVFARVARARRAAPQQAVATACPAAAGIGAQAGRPAPRYREA